MARLHVSGRYPQMSLHRGWAEQLPQGRVVREVQQPPLRRRRLVVMAPGRVRAPAPLVFLVEFVDNGKGALLAVVELRPRIQGLNLRAADAGHSVLLALAPAGPEDPACVVQ